MILIVYCKKNYILSTYQLKSIVVKKPYFSISLTQVVSSIK